MKIFWKPFLIFKLPFIDGVDLVSYRIIVESKELDKIRKDLTGLPPQVFCFDVAVNRESMLNNLRKLNLLNMIKTMKEKLNVWMSECLEGAETARSEDEEETKASEVSIASKSMTKKKTPAPTMKNPAPASEINKSNLLLLAIITTAIVVMSTFGYNYFSN